MQHISNYLSVLFLYMYNVFIIQCIYNAEMERWNDDDIVFDWSLESFIKKKKHAKIHENYANKM